MFLFGLGWRLLFAFAPGEEEKEGSVTPLLVGRHDNEYKAQVSAHSRFARTQRMQRSGKSTGKGNFSFQQPNLPDPSISMSVMYQSGTLNRTPLCTRNFFFKKKIEDGATAD